MKRCIITGAEGLIGSHVLQTLPSEWEIYAVSRRDVPDLRRANIHWHVLDLCTPFQMGALPARADVVVYLAQSEHFRDFPARASDIFNVNTVGVLRFLDYARVAGVANFVLASSGGVYGFGNKSMTEEVVISSERHLGFYLSTKLCSEILARNYLQLMNIAILRLFFVYGQNQRRHMLIPRLIENVRAGRPILLQGESGIRVNPTHVSDAASAIRCATELTGAHTINVGGPEVLSMREIGAIIGKAVGREPVFEVDRNAMPQHIVGDITKMRKLLIPPAVRFDQGLRSML
jgi:nucleoside-diphosphate-sugar epimerase